MLWKLGNHFPKFKIYIWNNEIISIKSVIRSHDSSLSHTNGNTGPLLALRLILLHTCCDHCDDVIKSHVTSTMYSVHCMYTQTLHVHCHSANLYILIPQAPCENSYSRVDWSSRWGTLAVALAAAIAEIAYSSDSFRLLQPTSSCQGTVAERNRVWRSVHKAKAVSWQALILLILYHYTERTCCLHCHLYVLLTITPVCWLLFVMFRYSLD